jgi:hypothetical protein
MRRFSLGVIVATPAAIAQLQREDIEGFPYLVRHARCDWGDMDAEDKARNDRALIEGTRLMSAYRLPSGDKIWVITEADRSATTILLPDDY